MSTDSRGGMVRDRSSDVFGPRRKLLKDTPEERLIAVWMWEYVLKHKDLKVVRAFAGSLPFPNDVPRLKQMTLIRRLSDILKVLGDVDFNEALGILEALEHSFEEEPLDEAGVGLDDAVLSKRLKTSSPDASKGKVSLDEGTSSESRHGAREDSVWKGLQQPVLEVKEDLRRLLGRSGCEEADAKIKVVKGKLSALVKSAWDLFGPGFLVKTEAAVISGRYRPQGVSLGIPLASGQNVAGTSGDNEADPGNEGDPGNEEDPGNEDDPENEGDPGNEDDPGNDDVSESAKREIDKRCVELEKNSGRNQELERARQALADSRAELEKLVRDPLPALLRKPGETAEAPETASGEKRQTAEPAVKRSLLEPHTSAQARGWDDDEFEESPSRRSPSASRRLHLPPIRRSARTTLLPRKPMTCESSFATGSSSKHRRPIRKWSDEEVEIFKREVHNYGKGNWKVILLKNKNVFSGRTEVDLKDKWRNLEKYSLV